MNSKLTEKLFEQKRYYTYPLFEQFSKELTAMSLSKDFDIADTQLIENMLKYESKQTTLLPLVSFTKQVHGIEILSFKINRSGTLPEFPAVREGDILMTNAPCLPLMIRTADCAAVIVYDPTLKIVANIHAGWRGIAQKAVAYTISELSKRYGSARQNLYATVSPMIGPCCAEFTDPEKELPHFMRPFFLEENHVDLWGAVENQLIGSGIDRAHIQNPRICTSCNPEMFPSYRRDKEASGRFGTIALLH